MDLHDQFNSPLLREWEVPDNATHYEKNFGAAPGDEEMLKMWTAWYITTYLFAIYTTSVLVAILFTKSVRKRPFNLFLVYLMIPDTLVLWFCGTSCLLNALAGQFTSMGHCKFQAFYLTVTVGANAWLNAAITRHLLNMLQSAHQFRKYQPPSRKRVTLESLALYAFNLFIGSWFLIDQADWWPFQIRLKAGVVCLPQDFNYLSTALYYGVFFPSFFLVPFLYVCYAVFIIWRQNLMPPSGRKRALAMYFFRLVVAFAVMWVPSLVLLVVTSPWTNPWLMWAGGFWAHMQGVVSGVLSLFKRDIWKAYVAFYKPLWGCFCPNRQSTDDGVESGDDCDSNNSSPIIQSSASTSFPNSMFFISNRGARQSTGSRFSSRAEILEELQEVEEQMAEEPPSRSQFNKSAIAGSDLSDLEDANGRDGSASATKPEDEYPTA